jgi:hypothetical protein
MNYDSNNDDVLRRARHSIVVALTSFSVVMVAGTFGYKHFSTPDTTWMDATYMTFLMVATIGYGAGVDIYHHPDRELFTMAVAFSGIGIMTYFFSSVTALVLASDFDKSMRRRRMDKMMKKLKATTSCAALAGSDATWLPNWRPPTITTSPSTKVWNCWNHMPRRSRTCSTFRVMLPTTIC